MTDQFDISKFLNLIKEAQGDVNGKEFLVSSVYDRLDAFSNPHDQAVLTLKTAMRRRFEKNTLSTISQKDFQDMYDQVSGLGNAEMFRDEYSDLLMRGSPLDGLMPKQSGLMALSGDEIELVSKDHVNKLASLFGESVQSYDSFVVTAKKSIALEIEDLGFSNVTAEPIARDENFVVFAAGFDTDRGQVVAYIPTEMINDTVVLPTHFATPNAFAELNEANLRRYAEIGDFNISPEKVLGKLTASLNKKAATEAVEGFSGQDIGSEGLYLSKEAFESDEASIVDARMDVEELPESLASMFSETLAESGISYGRDTVLEAKAALGRELFSANIRHDKIVIASETSNGVMLQTNIKGLGGTKTIDVPVEIADGQVLVPSKFFAGAQIHDFSDDSLLAFANAHNEVSFDSLLSKKSDMSFEQLYTDAMTNAVVGKFVDMEESLAVIDDKFGHERYKQAFQGLHSLMATANVKDPVQAMSDTERHLEKLKKDLKDSEVIKMTDGISMLYPEG